MQIGQFNFGGLASGIDTRALIDAILQAERQPIQRLEIKRSQLNARDSALGDLRGQVNGVVDALKGLSKETTLNGRVTTVSDETAFLATAGTGSDIGSFSIEVLELAAAAKVKSNGLAASDQSLVSAGTITITSGDNDPITIDVSPGSGNDDLRSVRDAINDADAGVEASVLFDGSEYRLIVRAETSGVDNDLVITDSTNLGLGDPLNVVTAASDARAEVDGIEITGSSNTLTNVIEGVTLDLLSPNEGTPGTLTVEKDVDGVIGAVQELVTAYNSATEFLNAQFKTDAPGPLSREGLARRLQLDLQSLVTGGVDGIPFGEIRSLSAIGVSFDGRSGALSVDTGELREQLETRFDSVVGLFRSGGTSSDSRVLFVSSDATTEAGEYAVEISQAAEQASVVGDRDLSGGMRRRDTLTITVGADVVDVDLARDMTIGEVVDTVNAALESAGIAATAFDESGRLRITTDGFGSDQSITVEATGNHAGFRRAPTNDLGQDVAGSIGGVAATGSGQTLTAADGESFAGLVLQITATADDIAATSGQFGTISFTQGLTGRPIGELTEITRLGDGRIDSSQDRIDDQLRAIEDEITRIEERLVSREARLVRTFAAAEQAISSLQAQQSRLGSFLSV
ncbi:MAG: flagellar filament capping protein FliD [bacterium]|nr:flagellar filament capping protein FliD [bacterium]